MSGAYDNNLLVYDIAHFCQNFLSNFKRFYRNCKQDIVNKKLLTSAIMFLKRYFLYFSCFSLQKPELFDTPVYSFTQFSRISEINFIIIVVNRCENAARNASYRIWRHCWSLPPGQVWRGTSSVVNLFRGKPSFVQMSQL